MDGRGGRGGVLVWDTRGGGVARGIRRNVTRRASRLLRELTIAVITARTGIALRYVGGLALIVRRASATFAAGGTNSAPTVARIQFTERLRKADSAHARRFLVTLLPWAVRIHLALRHRRVGPGAVHPVTQRHRAAGEPVVLGSAAPPRPAAPVPERVAVRQDAFRRIGPVSPYPGGAGGQEGGKGG